MKQIPASRGAKHLSNLYTKAAQVRFAVVHPLPADDAKQRFVNLSLQLPLLVGVAGEIGKAGKNGADLFCYLLGIFQVLLLQEPENLKCVRIEAAFSAGLFGLRLLLHQRFDLGHRSVVDTWRSSNAAITDSARSASEMRYGSLAPLSAALLTRLFTKLMTLPLSELFYTDLAWLRCQCWQAAGSGL
jgi:hypothetical protein